MRKTIVLLICLSVIIISCGKVNSKNLNDNGISDNEDDNNQEENGVPIESNEDITFLDYVCGEYHYTPKAEDEITGNIYISNTGSGTYSFRVTVENINGDEEEKWECNQESIKAIQNNQIWMNVSDDEHYLLVFGPMKVDMYEYDPETMSHGYLIKGPYYKEATDEEIKSLNYYQNNQSICNSFLNDHMKAWFYWPSNSNYVGDGKLEITYDEATYLYYISIYNPAYYNARDLSDFGNLEDYVFSSDEIIYCDDRCLYLLHNSGDSNEYFKLVFDFKDFFYDLYKYENNNFSDVGDLIGGGELKPGQNTSDKSNPSEIDYDNWYATVPEAADYFTSAMGEYSVSGSDYNGKKVDAVIKILNDDYYDDILDALQVEIPGFSQNSDGSVDLYEEPWYFMMASYVTCIDGNDVYIVNPTPHDYEGDEEYEGEDVSWTTFEYFILKFSNDKSKIDCYYSSLSYDDAKYIFTAYKK